jgi:hypothetical protein
MFGCTQVKFALSIAKKSTRKNSFTPKTDKKLPVLEECFDFLACDEQIRQLRFHSFVEIPVAADS